MKENVYENIVGTGKLLGISIMFSTFCKTDFEFLGSIYFVAVKYFLPLFSNFKLLSASCSSLEESEFFCFGKGLLFTIRSCILTTLDKKAFKNIVRKGKNDGNQHFLLFTQCFLTIPKKEILF